MKSVKKDLKAWVKHHVAVRGDRILWGQPLTGDMRRRKAKVGEPGNGGGDDEETQRQQDNLPGQEVVEEPARIRQEGEDWVEEVQGTRAAGLSKPHCKLIARQVTKVTGTSRKEKRRTS